MRDWPCVRPLSVSIPQASCRGLAVRINNLGHRLLRGLTWFCDNDIGPRYCERCCENNRDEDVHMVASFATRGHVISL